MRYVLGIDGGNSKTLAMVADETGAVLGAGRAGSGSHQAVGIDRALDAIDHAATEALTGARLTGEDLTAVYYALAGADLEVDYAILRPRIAERPLAPLWDLDNDIVAVLRSGTDARNAIAVGLGSGTNAMGRDSSGREIRLPALGWISGDWGGGGDLAEEVVRLAARAWDGRGAPTLLQEMILTDLGLPDMETLIVKLHTAELRGRDILHLPRVLFRAADAGDAVAVQLVVRQAEEVAVTATALLRRLDLLDTPTDVVLGGSIFRCDSTLLVDTIRRAIAGVTPNASVVVPEVEPAAGAVLSALDLAGIHRDAATREALLRTSRTALRAAPEEVRA